MACGAASLLFPAGTLPASFANLSALYLVLNLNNNHLSGVQDTLFKVNNCVHAYSPSHILADIFPEVMPPCSAFLPVCQQCPGCAGKGR